MRMALAEARQAMDEDEIPIGAVIVSAKGSVIGRGHNLTETLTDVSAHAEMQAITADSRWQVSARMHPICHGRALHHVCRSYRVGTDQPCGLWCSG